MSVNDGASLMRLNERLVTRLTLRRQSFWKSREQRTTSSRLCSELVSVFVGEESHMRPRKTKDAYGGPSEKALVDATQNLRNVQARTPEVREVAQALRGFRERNHFAEQLHDMMTGVNRKRA